MKPVRKPARSHKSTGRFLVGDTYSSPLALIKGASTPATLRNLAPTKENGCTKRCYAVCQRRAIHAIRPNNSVKSGDKSPTVLLLPNKKSPRREVPRAKDYVRPRVGEGYFLVIFFFAATVRFGPLRVRALVFVR